MSATTTVREPRRVRSGAKASAWTLPERVRIMFGSLRARFGAIRLPAYVSAFEVEHLATLAEWSVCRTGMAGRPVIEQQYGGE
jgi:hypothetical protein